MNGAIYRAIDLDISSFQFVRSHVEFSRVKTMLQNLNLIAGLLGLTSLASGARQDQDVRKIIEAFRRPQADLTILCAHRGLRCYIPIL
jgi:hypothetical protein